MPKLEYPAYFEGGLLGVKVKESINHREAYMYVPFKMLMSIDKAKSHPVVGKIIKENPECFSKSQNQDWEQLTLALFIFYEMTLGKQSYWYPYLRLMPDVEFTSSWSEEEMSAIQDKQLSEHLNDYHVEVEVEWHMFKKILTSYNQIFKKKFVDRGLFFNIYG